MLTSSQQAALDYHLRRINRLTNEDLIQELTDHYTAALNERMVQGMNVETALTSIQRDFGGKKGLQKLERQYNQVTFRKYDALWMQYIRKQSQWPRSLMPVSVFGIIYWTTTHTGRPSSFSVNALTHNPWFGFILGSILGLVIKFGQLVIQGGIRGKNFPYKAVYLVTRVIPIALILYGICALLTYLNAYFPPFVYEAIMSACAAMTVTYTISYSQFYQAVFKKSQKAG